MANRVMLIPAFSGPVDQNEDQGVGNECQKGVKWPSRPLWPRGASGDLFLAEVIDSGVERDKLDTHWKLHVEIRRFWPLGASDDTDDDQGSLQHPSIER